MDTAAPPPKAGGKKKKGKRKNDTVREDPAKIAKLEEMEKYAAAADVAARELQMAADKKAAKRARKAAKKAVENGEAPMDQEVCCIWVFMLLTVSQRPPMSLVPLKTNDIGVSKVEVADCTHEVSEKTHTHSMKPLRCPEP